MSSISAVARHPRAPICPNVGRNGDPTTDRRPKGLFKGEFKSRPGVAEVFLRFSLASGAKL